MVEKTQPGPLFLSLERAACLVGDDSLLAMGGNMRMEPMAFIRELVRQGRKGLRLVTVPGGGIGVDMLIGADGVESIETPQISGLICDFIRAPGRSHGNTIYTRAGYPRFTLFQYSAEI